METILDKWGMLPCTHGRRHLGAGHGGVGVYGLHTDHNTRHNLKWDPMMIDQEKRIYSGSEVFLLKDEGYNNFPA